ncbi:MAG: hypothetical protein JZU63_00125, partial [Rhodoferax sp.]|nr:hypothetical protein [Rhodoferax sp.]
MSTRLDLNKPLTPLLYSLHCWQHFLYVHQRRHMRWVQSVLHWPVCLGCMHGHIEHLVYTVPRWQRLSFPDNFHYHCLWCWDVFYRL